MKLANLLQLQAAPRVESAGASAVSASASNEPGPQGGAIDGFAALLAACGQPTGAMAVKSLQAGDDEAIADDAAAAPDEMSGETSDVERAGGRESPDAENGTDERIDAFDAAALAGLIWSPQAAPRPEALEPADSSSLGVDGASATSPVAGATPPEGSAAARSADAPPSPAQAPVNAAIVDLADASSAESAEAALGADFDDARARDASRPADTGRTEAAAASAQAAMPAPEARQRPDLTQPAAWAAIQARPMADAQAATEVRREERPGRAAEERRAVDAAAPPVGWSAWAAPAPLRADAPVAPVAEMHLSTPVDHEDFGAALSLQVSTLVREGVHDARMQLNPQDMGPISIRIEVDGRDAQVHFAAAEPATRELLHASLPALEQALQSDGLQLAGSSVADPGAQQGQSAKAQGEGRQGSQPAPRRWRMAGPDGVPGAPAEATAPRAASGVLDLYA